MKIDLINKNKKLGILGGGQLGKMLIQSASRWNIYCAVLDPSPECPASTYANEVVTGKFSDYDAVKNFGKDKDILTIEIENVNTQALRELRDEGKVVHPSPECLEIIKDKGIQKQFYTDNNIPTSAYRLFEGVDEIKQALDKGDLSLPFVQKSRREGYDGRGVAVIKSESDLNNLLESPSVVETLVDIDKEISVIVSRNENGEVNTFPAVEMEFDQGANLVDKLIAPARINVETAEKATELAKMVVQSLKLVGVMAIEMFLDEQGKLLVNESAPRPHNSGHHTIEANHSSQYEQHLRAILGMPLGNNDMTQKAAMINLLGEAGSTGKTVYEGLEEAWKTEGAHVHLYGKKESKPFRKMGHITICGNEMEKLINLANNLKKKVRVKGELIEN